MIPPLHLLCAQLGLIGYDPSFLGSPRLTAAAGLANLGRSLVSLIWGFDHGVGRVPYGFISMGAAGPICTIRGTQSPAGSLVEWLDDFDAVLEQCPWAPTGARWHRGFGRVYSTLKDDNGTPIAQALQAIPGVTVHGHSLGGPLATYAAGEARAGAPVLFASPKCGDSGLRDYLLSLWPPAFINNAFIFFASYANANDAVPKVPITVDWPFKLEDFQQVVPLTELAASSVTPPIAGNWNASHNLASYLRLLLAVT